MGVWAGGSLGHMDDGGVPNITGGFGVYTDKNYYSSVEGCFGMEEITARGESYAFSGRSPFYTFDASRSSTAYSRDDNFVIPRRLSVYYIIKY